MLKRARLFWKAIHSERRVAEMADAIFRARAMLTGVWVMFYLSATLRGSPCPTWEEFSRPLKTRLLRLRYFCRERGIRYPAYLDLE